MVNCMQSFVQYTRSVISNEETFLQEANASELLENHELIFPRYYMHSGMIGMFKSSTTLWYVVSS